jgi:hypothetical protein
MATKSGQMQWKDIKASRAGWIVEVVYDPEQNLSKTPVQVMFTERPWIRPTLDILYIGPCFGVLFTQNGEYQRRNLRVDHFDMAPKQSDGVFFAGAPIRKNNRILHRIFTTKQAAERYQARVGLKVVSEKEFNEARGRAIRKAIERGQRKLINNSRTGALGVPLNAHSS